MKRILFTGGGTTGHVTKNMILLEALAEQQPELERHYAGLRTGKEHELIKPALAHFHIVTSGKLRRYASLQTLPDFFRFLKGIWQSWKLMKRLKPDLVFSSGGYVALPVCIGAWLRNVPVVAHETDSYPGLSNRLIARVSDQILLGFETAKQYLEGEKVHYTGNPVSPALFGGSRERGLKKLGFVDDRRVLLVMGGSQGAQQINELVWDVLERILPDWQVIHLTGAGKQNIEKMEGYRSFEYVTKEYADFLQTADLVICRGGGNSLTEVAALGKSAIVIPLLSAAGDHQRKNAIEMASKRGNWQVLDQQELVSEDLLAALQKASPSAKISKKSLEEAKKRAHDTVDTILRHLVTSLEL